MSRSSRRFAARKSFRAYGDSARAVAVDGIPLADALFVVAVIVASLFGIAIAAAMLTGGAVPSSVLEVPLGEFKCGAGTKPDRGELQFRAIALVGGSQELQSEKAEMLSRHSARVSQAVEEAGRAADEQEFLEPDLKRFRSRVCTRVNQALGSYLVEDVLLHHFHVWDSGGLAQAHKRIDRHDGI